MNSEPTDRDDAIEALYQDNPSLRALHERGLIDQESYEKAKELRASGPPKYALSALVAALRAERERQGLSLTDIAERTGMDRAAVHKLEIGLNKNPTCATLQRYADALGLQIAWELLPKEPAKLGAHRRSGLSSLNEGRGVLRKESSK
jgi:DNA-binding phage protein